MYCLTSDNDKILPLALEFIVIVVKIKLYLCR